PILPSPYRWKIFRIRSPRWLCGWINEKLRRAMPNIREKMTTDFCRTLEETVGTTVKQTLEAMFGCRIDVNRTGPAETDDVVIASVNFRQGVETISLRLVFERAFIHSLIRGYYS